ncbi:MAG: LuxR C-terminal-related transcriptional regulator [Cyclobacteriaceae bacterium]|nr:LuxR C-terminal-related transcriptional regulator [Cyclobacteriaceae bacterium]
MNSLSNKVVDIKGNNRSVFHKLERIKRQERFRNIHLLQFESLTKRELEIITFIVLGYNNPKIALQLSISRNTVEQHRKNINKKLKVNSFPKLFEYALAFDII